MTIPNLILPNHIQVVPVVDNLGTKKIPTISDRDNFLNEVGNVFLINDQRVLYVRQYHCV
jgi:hypothetical protein